MARLPRACGIPTLWVFQYNIHKAQAVLPCAGSADCFYISDVNQRFTDKIRDCFYISGFKEVQNSIQGRILPKMLNQNYFYFVTTVQIILSLVTVLLYDLLQCKRYLFSLYNDSIVGLKKKKKTLLLLTKMFSWTQINAPSPWQYRWKYRSYISNNS